MNNLPTPPALMGTEIQQIGQIRSYLFRISEMLNAAMTEQNIVLEQTAQRQSNSVSSEAFSKEIDDQYQRLKSLIINTADIVYMEMEKVETELRQQYIAKSEWGTYEESINNEIKATAEGIVQSYNYDSKIADVAAGVADFEAYKIATSGYIQSGEVYSEIDMTKNLATYTSDRITFWQNGIEVAYISNSEMGITSVHIKGKINMDDEWEISRINGFTVKWIGGE